MIIFFHAGMKTYLISGRKLEQDVQCGCSQARRSRGDSALCSQPCTLELISGGAAQAVAQPPLVHQPPDKMLVSVSEDELR